MSGSISGLVHTGLVFSPLAGADFRTTEFRIVKQSATINTVSLCGAGECAIGFIQEGVNSGEVQPVYALQGKARITAGGVYSIGNFLKATTNGKLIVETSPTTKTADTVAVAAEASTADGDIKSVIFV